MPWRDDFQDKAGILSDRHVLRKARIVHPVRAALLHMQ
jgi:hypothetical protein